MTSLDAVEAVFAADDATFSAELEVVALEALSSVTLSAIVCEIGRISVRLKALLKISA